MKQKTASQIFGTFLPYPQIKSVTLEGGGSTIKSMDPHIVTPGGFNEDTNSGDSENSLKIKIIVSLRDVLETSGLTAFFDEEKILNVMNVAVLQVTDASQAASYMEDKVSLYSKVLPLLDGQVTNYFKYFPAMTSEDKLKSTTINGEVILEKPYTFNFELSNLRPKHLSYFCICTIDYSAFAEQFGLEPKEAEDAFSGALATDLFESSHIVVIDGGAVSYTENVFYLPNGTPWTGPTHKIGSVFYTGNSDTTEPKEILTKKLTSAQAAIKDFRDLNGLPFSKDEFYKSQSELVNFVGSSYEKKLVNEIVKKTRESVLYDLITYVPPGKYNGQLFTESSIVLVLDNKKLTEQYAKLSNVTIKPKSVKLFRNNVMTSDPPEDFIALIGTPTLSGLDNSRYHTLVFSDYNIAPGNYTYHAEIELNIDEHIKLVDDTISSLSILIKDLGDYYTLATSTFNEDDNLFLDKNIGSISHTEDFDLTKNKKTPMFNSNIGKYIPQFKTQSSNLFDSISEQIDSLTVTLMATTSQSQYYTNKKILHAALDPTFGTPDGISAVQKIFINALQDYEKIYGRKTTKTSYSEDHAQKSASKARSYEKIIINLQSTLNLSKGVDFGYEYLPRPGQGIPNYSRDQFEQELISRADKYFDLESGPVPLISGIGSFGEISDSLYQYVGTRRIFAGNVILNNSDLEVNDIKLQKQVECLLSVIDYNLVGLQSRPNKPNVFNTLSTLGITPQFKTDFSHPNFSEIPEADPTETESNNLDDPINYNGTMIKLGLNSPESEYLFSIIRNSDSKFSDMKDIRFYNISQTIPGNQGIPVEGKSVYQSKANKLGPPSKQWGNIILDIQLRVDEDLPFDEGSLAGLPPSQVGLALTAQVNAAEARLQDYLSRMPIQTKALILSSRSNQPVSPSIKSIGPFEEAKENNVVVQKVDPRKTLGPKYLRHWFNYDNIARIEFLSTFENGVANPKWETLKELPEANGSGDKILCRLVKYESKLFNIRRPKVLELPIYNEYFLITL